MQNDLGQQCKSAKQGDEQLQGLPLERRRAAPEGVEPYDDLVGHRCKHDLITAIDPHANRPAHEHSGGHNRQQVAADPTHNSSSQSSKYKVESSIDPEAIR